MKYNLEKYQWMVISKQKIKEIFRNNVPSIQKSQQFQIKRCKTVKGKNENDFYQSPEQDNFTKLKFSTRGRYTNFVNSMNKLVK